MVVIRTARASDFTEVLRLWDSSAGPTQLPSNEDALSHLVARDVGALLLAEDKNRIVGSLIIGWDGWRCHLYRLAVHPTFRRRGIASQLVSTARERARALGARRLDAMVDEGNDAAHFFWERLGFTRHGDNRRWAARV